MAIEDGTDSITEFLFCVDSEHIYRILSYLERYFDLYYGYGLLCKNEVIDELRNLIDT